jgi:Mce-associated membrane protein
MRTGGSGKDRGRRIVWDSSSGAPGPRTILIVLASLLAVLVLVVVGFRVLAPGTLPSARSGASRSQDRVDAVTTAAREATVAFLDVDYRDMAPRVRRMLALSTGPFRSQYQGSAAALTAAAVRGKAISSGVVRIIGIDRIGPSSALVHVAADSTVSNLAIQQAHQAGKPVENRRSYRFRLTLTRVGDGWLLSELQFVA